ncbi:MAG: hypothetical protein HOP13_09345 [Alphaproteobacteria bacterium]|nr:hypothetical protein [Alphaproteobacteria bacterium]
MNEPKVLCRTPTPGKSAKAIAKWKYDLVRGAILKAAPKTAGGVAFGDLAVLVAKGLPASDRKRLGSVNWYTTTVKLHMETTGELQRIAGAHPQRLRRT